MLNTDLAVLYSVEPGTLVLAGKRDIERFPEDFMFQLTPVEYRILKSIPNRPVIFNSLQGQLGLPRQVVRGHGTACVDVMRTTWRTPTRMSANARCPKITIAANTRATATTTYWWVVAPLSSRSTLINLANLT